jgi:hypothetical protein
MMCEPTPSYPSPLQVLQALRVPQGERPYEGRNDLLLESNDH